MFCFGHNERYESHSIHFLLPQILGSGEMFSVSPFMTLAPFLYQQPRRMTVTTSSWNEDYLGDCLTPALSFRLNPASPSTGSSPDIPGLCWRLPVRFSEALAMGNVDLSSLPILDTLLSYFKGLTDSIWAAILKQHASVSSLARNPFKNGCIFLLHCSCVWKREWNEDTLPLLVHHDEQLVCRSSMLQNQGVCCHMKRDPQPEIQSSYTLVSISYC